MRIYLVGLLNKANRHLAAVFVLGGHKKGLYPADRGRSLGTVHIAESVMRRLNLSNIDMCPSYNADKSHAMQLWFSSPVRQQ
jgi:hypothetical protein